MNRSPSVLNSRQSPPQEPGTYEQIYAQCRESRRLHEAAGSLFPGGVLHAIRSAEPFPLYFPSGKGSRKWDADGNEYVDYHLGSGALLLGHQHPRVLEAIERQLQVAYHVGKGHPLELEWGRRIQHIVPNAELVRFTNSGSEATLLAMRVARAYTGRNKILRFHAHYHGWHDYAMVGATHPYDAPPGGGVPDAIAALMPTAPSHDLAKARALLRDDSDIAAVIVEASGASYGRAPLPPKFLADVREMTAARKVPLILDEIITGFRWAPGGVQQSARIDADLITLGKIVSGGMPAAAVVGKADIMQVLHEPGARGKRVYHAGTFNANPLAAAAGIATLDMVAGGEPPSRADAAASQLRRALNDVMQRANLAGCVYGESSTLHVYFGDCPPREADDQPLWTYDPAVLTPPAEQVAAVHRAFQAHGIDLMSRMSGVTSSEHTAGDIDWTVDAFSKATTELLALGVIHRRGGAA